MELMLDFSDVLAHVDEFPWDEALFLPEDRNWSLDARCAVLNLDDCAEEEVPRFASDNGLTYALTIQQLQDVVSNARQQRSDCTVEDLLEAFLYYHKRDAFIVFE